MSIQGKIETAMKYANDEGVLICEVDYAMKSINVSTLTGYRRMIAILRDSPESIVGFYKVNDNFNEDQVREYITDDTLNLL